MGLRGLGVAEFGVPHTRLRLSEERYETQKSHAYCKVQSSVFDLSLKKTNPFAENFEAVNKHNLSVEKDAEKAQLSTEQNTKKDDLLAEKDAIIADLQKSKSPNTYYLLDKKYFRS